MSIESLILELRRDIAEIKSHVMPRPKPKTFEDSVQRTLDRQGKKSKYRK